MKTVEFQNLGLTRDLFGQQNINLDKISEAFDVKINSRGNSLLIHGDSRNVSLAEKLLHQFYHLMENNFCFNEADFDSAINTIKLNNQTHLKDIFLTTIYKTVKNKPITPRNPAQQKYTEAIAKNDILFSIGPAGTGKTYIAMALAMAAFSRGEIKKIVLTRPAVEAGEALGFLPGDLAQKINPYLRPLYDALYDMMEVEKAKSLMEQDIIEIAPLAFMRGRTLNNAFIILDEAQNTTSEQMKMFLTRIGYGSKAIITGDITQTDLPSKIQSGLVEAKNILTRIKGIEFVYFSKDDVVRHKLVSNIIDAYEKKQDRK
ncbi:MAG: phosphate starvation-inducible protein PhoH [Desulfobacula sp. RIFOXYA12_FULL_46_16]|nr:MAG: phosphate starvation-inducible protein PhoH [Deltaproteobacteria bacterium RIFOXYC2_FULL_48_10]OGR20250.1 MAG: phosphate starvation-inducible protein PhoH [Desulfobacula sp. RIFOXYA12_FULL_46_16]OGR60425.1 MAG: phosphate starvation-inducible protein PhoH [Desulfobacula sp. RIFOXYB2_FULL_45_6]